MVLRFGGLAAAFVLLLGACSTSSDGRDLSTPTTTTPTTVPAAITVGYLNGVIDQLDHLVGEAFRELVRDRGPNARFVELLDAVYDEPQFEEEQGSYGEIAADDFRNVRPNPGDPVTVVERIIKAEPNCIVVRVNRDFAPFFADPQAASTMGFLALVPTTQGLNTTGWSIVFDGGTLNDEAPVNPC